MKRYLLFLITLLLLGCGGGEESNSDNQTSNIDNKENSKEYSVINLKYDGSSNVIPIFGNRNNFTLNIDLGFYQKDVYLIFTNKNDYVTSSQASVVDWRVTETFNIRKKIAYFNENPPRFTEKDRKEISRRVTSPTSDFVGKEEIFYGYNDKNNQDNIIEATCKKIIKTEGKTLSIWVDNLSFGTQCIKSRCITQDMIDAIGETFLKEGRNNDIYDWVTNIIGEEWGEHSKPYFITPNNQITILFTDLERDNSTNGGFIGLFYAKDNYKREYVPYSNERLMFYVDSVMFANGDSDNWSIDDRWPKESVVTLAHEFQHMIHFYQKFVKNNLTKNSDTWINEMSSMMIEDLLSYKLKSVGPRNVPYYDESAGNYPIYNGILHTFPKYNYISLTDWYDRGEDAERDVLNSYAIAYSFGAYLLRNYRGAEVLRNIVQNRYRDFYAVVDAVHKEPNGANKSFADLMKEWGASVLLSDKTDTPIPYRYNSGNWFVSYMNGVEYKMGSINIFNYYPYLTLFSSPYGFQYSNATRYPHSNAFYLVGYNLNGKIRENIRVEDNVDVTIVFK